MDIRRAVLYALLGFVIYNLWSAWQHDYPAEPVVSQATSSESVHEPRGAIARHSDGVTSSRPAPTQTIQIKNDVLALTIDLNQGNIIQANLLDYPVSTENKAPIQLLFDHENKRYVANSQLISYQSQNNHEPILFSASQSTYQLAPDQNTLDVTLTAHNAQGLEIKKTFTLTKNSYAIKVNYQVKNTTNTPWQGYFKTELLQRAPVEDSSSLFHVGSYTGASYSNPGHHRYQKVSFKEIGKHPLEVNVAGGWVAMQQHYFLSAWIPHPAEKNLIFTRYNQGDYIIGSLSKAFTVAPNETRHDIGAKLYLGPEDTAVLKELAPGLELTVDYGWLWFLSSILFSVMKAIYTVVGNWGWSIVLVTVLIKLAFYRLSATSYKSMAGMRQLQPKLQALRDRFGDDKAKISQATMELYRREKINPLGGCLPILIQIPVFIALYWVLLESVELRQAPFIFWIHDLSSADPYHILPIIMGATMLVQQRLNPAPPDPMQAKIMMFLPVLFTGLFWSFPAGLVLYWIVNNTLSILQQWYITRKYGDTPSNSPKLVSAK
ncbi:MAG TPA: membrane protein insertase YidC [Legionellales bacterium]|nr:membrane protein insertase YidC [Legionellales bacterium]